MVAPAAVPDRAEAVRIAWPTTALVALVCVTVLAAAVGRWTLLGPIHRLPSVPGPSLPTEVVSPLVAVVLTVLGALVVIRGRPPRYGWLLLAMGATNGVVGFAADYSVYAALAGHVDLPFATAAGWVQDLWMTTWVLGFLLLPALFPDGEPASTRWGRRVRAATWAWVALITVFMLTERPMTNAFLDVEAAPDNPTGLLPVPDLASNLAWVALTLASIAIGIGSLVTRWRAADHELRQQLKWVLYAFGLMLAVGAADLANQVFEAGLELDLGLRWPLSALFAMTMIVLAVSLGFAVLRFRLYAVDLVINRTLVYGTLTVAIVVAYVVIVVGIGALLPGRETFLSLVATGLVAVAFAPVRTWLQGRVNHLVFGQRDDPYAVLSELGRQLAAAGAPDSALQTLAETVATTLKLPGVAVELEQDGSWRTRAVHGTMPDEATGGVVVPLHHQGEVVGRLLVAARSHREPLGPADRRLLDDMSHQSGALAHAARLATALQRSRERLVLAREEERRRIRRDLHDGLGPSLASQTFRLDAVLERLQDDPAEAADLVAALKHHNQELVADIRRLVDELRPPALDQLGLHGALTAHAGQLDRTGHLAITVETDPEPLPPLPAAVEVAAYRIAREAITNVVHHAAATRCTLTVEVTDTAMSLTATDNGIGLGDADQPGVGLLSMRERAEELGGTFELCAARPSGTHVRATLPITTPPARPPTRVFPTRDRTGVPHG
jgi:signal transduction histidine kinase